jgi:hypothetical protein
MKFIAAICLAVTVISLLASCNFKTIPYPYIARSEALNATKALKSSTLMVMNNEGSPYSSALAAQ